MIAAFLVGTSTFTTSRNDWGGAQLVVEPGRSGQISRLVLVSCEAFDNYPAGPAGGRLLCLSASVPGGLFVVAHDSFTLIPFDQPDVLVRPLREFVGTATG